MRSKRSANLVGAAFSASNGRAAVHFAVLTLLSLSFAFPLVWLLSTALKNGAQIYSKPTAFFPLPLHWSNFADVFRQYGMLRYVKNTLIIVAASTAGNISASSMAAYALARLRFRGREAIFFATLSCMFIPGFLLIVPRFVIFKNIGLIGTLLPVILPPALGTPFSVFMLRQFFRAIPPELSEAARIDGCNEYRICFQIIAPLAKPAFITLVIFNTQWRWNEFLAPLIYLTDERLHTITLGLYKIMGLDAEEPTTHMVMAAVALSIVPIVVMFLIFQRYFVEGLSHVGMKR